jgi:hypothetical protein
VRTFTGQRDHLAALPYRYPRNQYGVSTCSLLHQGVKFFHSGAQVNRVADAAEHKQSVAVIRSKVKHPRSYAIDTRHRERTGNCRERL